MTDRRVCHCGQSEAIPPQLITKWHEIFAFKNLSTNDFTFRTARD